MKHVHHDSIVAWAADPSQPWEFLSPVLGEWRSVGPKAPSWAEENQYRIKPAAPEYPKASISDEALETLWSKTGGGSFLESLREVADAALRHEFETGAIITKPDDDQNVADLIRARRTLHHLGYTDHGGELWKPPLGKAPDFDAIDRARAARELAIAEAVRVKMEGVTIVEIGTISYTITSKPKTRAEVNVMLDEAIASVKP